MRLLLKMELLNIFMMTHLTNRPLGKGKLVALLNGFAKKSHKTPKKVIDKAVRSTQEYYEEK